MAREKESHCVPRWIQIGFKRHFLCERKTLWKRVHTLPQGSTYGINKVIVLLSLWYNSATTVWVFPLLFWFSFFRICTLPIVSYNFRRSFRSAASNSLTRGSFKINQDLRSLSVHSFYLGGILWGHLNQSFSCFASTDAQHHPHRGSFDTAHLANFFLVFGSRDTFFPVCHHLDPLELCTVLMYRKWKKFGRKETRFELLMAWNTFRIN